MELINGKAIADTVLAELKEEVSALPPNSARPTIAFIRVGEDPASITYVTRKQQTAAQLGFESIAKILPELMSQAALLKEIESFNADSTVHGILIQAPLPSHISEYTAFNHVIASKDVDGFSAINLGKLCQQDDSGLTPCTPAGIQEIFKREALETKGKHIVIIGRSLIVGKPAALLFLKKDTFGNATVTVCHSQTKDLESIVKSADIIIAAAGQANLITADMVTPGAIVIDVGMNRTEAPSTKKGYRLTGDVDFTHVAPLCKKITPVPGGVGPMTVAMLMKNTWRAYQSQTSNR